MKLLEDLAERIARLSMALGLSLADVSDLQRALTLAPTDRHAHFSAHDSSALQYGLRTELRGLLVMRYMLVQHYAALVGAGATRKLVAFAEQNLQAHGFAPGADGMLPDGTAVGR